MGRVLHPDTRGERGRQHEKKIRRLSKSPCGRPPSAPTGLTGSFDRLEGGRGGHRIRLSMKWTEVTTDTSGNSTRIRIYKLELEYSANGTDWFLVDRYTVPGKDDTDSGALAHKAVKGIKGRLQYRYRVRAIDTDKCKSEWSSYLVAGAPNAETPPAPTNVRIYDRSVDRVVLDWDDTADPNDTERRRDDQTYFSAELSVVSNFNTIYKRDRHIGHTRWSVRIPDADTGGIFYGRVWSNNDTGDKNFKSLKIPGTFGGNSNPNAAPDFVFLKEIGAGASTCDPGEIRNPGGPLKPAWSRCVSGSPSQPSGAPRLVADGCLYSTTNYAAVFAEYGYIYGGSGGSFAVPDLRHRKVVGASSDAELGQNDGLVVTDRTDDHAIHGDHPNHGTHAHDGHTGHNSHRTDNVGEASHGHFVQGVNSDQTTLGSSNTRQGNLAGQVVTQASHGHGVPAHFTNSGANHNHQHNVGHDDAAGSRGHSDHSTHQGHNHNEHTAGEHDSNRPAGQGHKPHGHSKHHFVVCTGL